MSLLTDACLTNENINLRVCSQICTLIEKIMGKRNSLDRRDASISCSSCCSQNNGGGIPCNADLCGLSMYQEELFVI